MGTAQAGVPSNGIKLSQEDLAMNSAFFSLLRTVALVVTVALGASCPLLAAAPPAPTLKIAKRDVHYEIQSDGSTITHYDLAYTVLAEAALARLSEQAISYHEGSGKLSEVVAYTRKADGQRIDLPATNIQVTSHSGVDGLPPAFSDLIDRRLIYPTLAVGDTVVLSYTLHDAKPTFPKRYSLMFYFDDDVPTDSASLTVTAPADFGLKTKSYQVNAATEQALTDGRRQRTTRLCCKHS